MVKLSKECTLNRFVVYADEQYYYSWIYPEARKKIIDYLTSTDRKDFRFEVLNANSLKDWMTSRIANNDAYKTVVVFAQDMIPETIAPDFSPSIVSRSYLDCGGRIVWMGDVPFFRQGKPFQGLAKLSKKEIEDKKNEIWVEWNINGIFSILGLNAEFNSSPNEKVEVTENGKKWGLREQNRWYGTRPIAEADEGVITFAENSAKRYKPPELLGPEEKKSVIETLTDALNKVSTAAGIFLGFLTALLTFFSFFFGSRIPLWTQSILLVAVIIGVVALFAGLPRLYRYYKKHRPKKYPNAWIKNFNKNYPYSGFVRLWDTQIYDVSNSNLEDLFNVAKYQL